MPFIKFANKNSETKMKTKKGKKEHFIYAIDGVGRSKDTYIKRQ